MKTAEQKVEATISADRAWMTFHDHQLLALAETHSGRLAYV
jgi:uncharacterized protein YecT (DUF1311 family)